MILAEIKLLARSSQRVYVHFLAFSPSDNNVNNGRVWTSDSRLSREKIEELSRGTCRGIEKLTRMIVPRRQSSKVGGSRTRAKLIKRVNREEKKKKKKRKENLVDDPGGMESRPTGTEEEEVIGYFGIHRIQDAAGSLEIRCGKTEREERVGGRISGGKNEFERIRSKREGNRKLIKS